MRLNWFNLKDLLFSKNIKNSAWHLLDTLIYPVLFFSTSPWFIDRLGEKEFGIWIFVNSIIVMMQLFNLGLGAATFKNVAAHTGVNNYEDAVKTINTNFSISFILQMLCIAVATAIAFGVKYFSVFNIEASYVHLAFTGILFGGVIVGLKFYEQIIAYTFKALERFDIAAWLNSGIKLTALLANVILIYLGYGLVTLFIATVIISFIGICLGIFLIRRHVPEYSLFFYFNRQSLGKELNFAVWIWLQSLVVIIAFQCDRLFVLTYIGLSTLTYYGLVATMFNHIHMGFSAIVPWLTPKVSRLKEQGTDPKILYSTSRSLSLLIALSVLLVFSSISAPLLKLVLSIDKYNQCIGYIRLFTLFELFFVYTIVPNDYLNAAGYEKLNFGIVFFYSAVIIAGMLGGYMLYKTAGGILIGLIASTAVSVFIQHLVVDKKVFSDSRWTETVILFLPAVLISAFILSEPMWLRASFFILSLVSLYLVFIRKNSINLNLLKHG